MDSEAVMEFLGDVSVLQRLPSLSVRKIGHHVILKHYNSGEYVFREGEPGGGIYFIWEGEVEVSRPFHADNHDSQVSQWGKFDHFTQSEPVGQEDVIALTKVTCLMLPHKYSHLMHPKSIWSADMNLETIAPVEHILSLDPLDVNTFRGITLNGAPKSAKVYGGQFMGQALSAASKTVNFLKILHSFHAHFLIAGDLNIPIIYQVDRLRDASNLATRRVNAVQNDRVVFFLIASFHKEEEGFDHQEPIMPSMPDPETLLSKYGLEEGVKLPRHHPKTEVSTSTYVPWPTEIRPVDYENYTRHTTRSPSVSYWLRAKGRLPDDQALHRCVGAYFSDLLFIQISLNPHRKESVFPSSISLDHSCVAAYTSDHIFLNVSLNPHRRKGLKTSSVSLNHSMWFHRPLRADDWLLFVISSPTAYNARGFVSGQMFNRKGELVASITQQGLIRETRTPSSPAVSKL